LIACDKKNGQDVWSANTARLLAGKSLQVAETPKLTGNGRGSMTNYRVSKAQSLRMRAADMKAEAAEARRAKAAGKKKAKADKDAGVATEDSNQ
jgi:hypothetical protein